MIDTVPQATERDIERAVEAAVRGQKEWEKVPVWKRGEILYRVLDIVEQNKEELAQTLCSENGKPIVEARAEIANIKISFSAFIEQAKALLRQYYSCRGRSRDRRPICSWLPEKRSALSPASFRLTFRVIYLIKKLHRL